MILLALSDFTGLNTIVRSIINDTLLQDFIDRYEKPYIIKLLGVTTGTAFIAGHTGPPYLVIKNEFYVQDGTTNRHSTGIKDILVSCILMEYIEKNMSQHSQSGVSSNLTEAAKMLDFQNAARYAEQRWNEMITYWENVQWYCKTYAPGDYPDFMGEEIKPRWSAAL